jgi:hypothetical protein
MIKRLTPKEKQKRKEKKNQLILGLTLVGLMILSTFGMIVNSFGNVEETKEITYNGYVFKENSGVYSLKLGDTEFYFKTNPLELKSLEYESNYSKLLSDYLAKPVYIDSKNELAYVELYQNLYPFVQKIQPACINAENCPSQEYPIKSCEDELIIIKEGTNNNIYQQENCIFIEGKMEDLNKLTDKFLFTIIGIDK